MTTSQPTTSATSGASGIATDVNGNPLVNPSTQMDENSFLKLLTAQLKYQDPLSPTDSQASSSRSRLSSRWSKES